MADWKQRYNDLLNSIKKKPVNFVIGLIVLILLVVLVGFSFQSPSTSLSPDNKSAFSKIKDLLTGNKEDKTEQTANVYIVKEGDYLWKIAEDTYGSGFNAYDIASANNIVDPNLIETGQELVLPDVEAKKMTKMEGETESMDSITSPEGKYKVVSGDYLWKIAKSVYGDPYKWVTIADANNLVNPNYLEVGQVLTLP